MMELRHLTDAQLLKGGYGCPQFEVRLPIPSDIIPLHAMHCTNHRLSSAKSQIPWHEVNH